jgi:hypothetical protein
MFQADGSPARSAQGTPVASHLLGSEADRHFAFRDFVGLVRHAMPLPTWTASPSVFTSDLSRCISPVVGDDEGLSARRLAGRSPKRLLATVLVLAWAADLRTVPLREAGGRA